MMMNNNNGMMNAIIPPQLQQSNHHEENGILQLEAANNRPQPQDLHSPPTTNVPTKMIGNAASSSTVASLASTSSRQPPQSATVTSPAGNASWQKTLQQANTIDGLDSSHQQQLLMSGINNADSFFAAQQQQQQQQRQLLLNQGLLGGNNNNINNINSNIVDQSSSSQLLNRSQNMPSQRPQVPTTAWDTLGGLSSSANNVNNDLGYSDSMLAVALAANNGTGGLGGFGSNNNNSNGNNFGSTSTNSMNTYGQNAASMNSAMQSMNFSNTLGNSYGNSSSSNMLMNNNALHQQQQILQQRQQNQHLLNNFDTMESMYQSNGFGGGGGGCSSGNISNNNNSQSLHQAMRRSSFGRGGEFSSQMQGMFGNDMMSVNAAANSLNFNNAMQNNYMMNSSLAGNGLGDFGGMDGGILGGNGGGGNNFMGGGVANDPFGALNGGDNSFSRAAAMNNFVNNADMMGTSGQAGGNTGYNLMQQSNFLDNWEFFQQQQQQQQLLMQQQQQQLLMQQQHQQQNQFGFSNPMQQQQQLLQPGNPLSPRPLPQSAPQSKSRSSSMSSSESMTQLDSAPLLGHTLLFSQPELQVHGGPLGSRVVNINKVGAIDGLTDHLSKHRKESKKKRAKTFPEKLMGALVDHADEDAIAWLPDGKSFVIVSSKQFVDRILNHTFKEAKYASFVRKLHRWGFVRLTSGTGTDCFHHPLFQRNHPELASRITCTPRDKDGTSKNTSRDKPPSLAGVEKFIRARAAAAAAADSKLGIVKNNTQNNDLSLVKEEDATAKDDNTMSNSVQPEHGPSNVKSEDAAPACSEV